MNKKSKNDFDVIIIGAGAAGIACAHRLRDAQKSVLILEARDRIGGRIFSAADKNSSLPLEFGAEFIHGAPSETFDLLERYDLQCYDVSDTHLFYQRRSLKPFPHFFERLGRIMKRLDKGKRLDRPVAEFMKSVRSPRSLKIIFKAFVENFHAVDTQLIGEHGLAADEETNDEDLNGCSLFRPLFAYDKILRSMLSECKNVVIQMRAPVDYVNWRKNHVEIRAAGTTYHAGKIVVSVPLGVLASAPGERGSIAWEPRPKAFQHIDAVQMGHVQKVIFKFKTRFWEDLNVDENPVSFMHTGTDHYFPTWWTFQPIRSPYLVGWQGGTRARQMGGWPTSKIKNEALKTLALITKKDLRFLQRHVVEYRHHNWTADPYARGAYSHVAVGGLKKARELNRPEAGTIFWAGEAFGSGDQRATVHGALKSGIVAAEQILKSYRIKQSKTKPSRTRRTSL